MGGIGGSGLTEQQRATLAAMLLYMQITLGGF
jgi:hypothetical protein